MADKYGSDDGNVFSFQTGHPAQHGPALAKIEAYWTQIRRGRLVPARSEIDPRGLEGSLKKSPFS